MSRWFLLAWFLFLAPHPRPVSKGEGISGVESTPAGLHQIRSLYARSMTANSLKRIINNRVATDCPVWQTIVLTLWSREVLRVISVINGTKRPYLQSDHMND
jgi:hypothetical protein